MSPYQRMCFLIEHMNSPFKAEIQRDFEASLKEARVDELLDTGISDGEIIHFNDDGSTTSTKEQRLKELGYDR